MEPDTHIPMAASGDVAHSTDTRDDIFRKLSAEDINALPHGEYTGAIHVIRSKRDIAAAVKELGQEKLLGFDTEKRPAFRKGESYAPALMQLGTSKAVYLFQLQLTGLPHALSHLLARPDIIKAGVAVTRDVIELQQLSHFEPASFVDLGILAERQGLQHHGLRGLAALLLGLRISKRARLTNWERPDLPPIALRYAATDAWLGRKLYRAMFKRGLIPAPGN